MQKRYLLIITIILCMAFCLGACKPAEPVDSNLTGNTPTPTVGGTTTGPDGETPGNTESSTTPTGGASVTPGKTPTTPDETPDNTTGSKPTATPTKGSTPTKTPKPTSGTKPKYVLYVNRMANVVTVYTADKNGNAGTPVKAMLCSTGRNNGTPTGTFAITEKYVWRPLFGNVYGQYACRFNGSILFHSVPYLKTNKGTLKPGEFNKLGTQASDGCVRLAVEDCKWIYDNCVAGTKVVVYDSADPGPLGKPSGLLISDNSGWDPTDPDAQNPWKKANPTMPITFYGISNQAIQIQRNGVLPDLYAGIRAVDAKGKNVTDYITISYNIDMTKTGTYPVVYTVHNLSTGVYSTLAANYQVVDKTVPVIENLVTSYRIAYDDVHTMTKERLLQGVTVLDDGDTLNPGGMIVTLNGQTYTPELLVAGEENRILLQVSDASGNVAEATVVISVTAPIETPDDTETPKPTPTPTPDTTETPEPTETPDSTETSEPTGTPEPTETPAKTERPNFVRTPIKA